MIYLVGVLRNEGKGRAVRYIRVINASNIVINVVKIKVIPKNTPWEERCQELLFVLLNLLLTEQGSFPSGRDVRDDHCEEDHHRHHRCDPHCYLCISFKNIPSLV